MSTHNGKIYRLEQAEAGVPRFFSASEIQRAVAAWEQRRGLTPRLGFRFHAKVAVAEANSKRRRNAPAS